jgi:hypothetical protein
MQEAPTTSPRSTGALLTGIAQRQVSLPAAVADSLRKTARDPFCWLMFLAAAFGFGLLVSALSHAREPLHLAVNFTTATLFAACNTFLSLAPLRVQLWPGGAHSARRLLLLNGPFVALFGVVAFGLSMACALGLFVGFDDAPRILRIVAGNALWGVFFVPTAFIAALSEERAHAAQQRARAWESMAEASRLALLRGQMNPHFFFNTLNTIAALIPTRPADAEHAVELLAATLRPALVRHPPALATLGEELALARAYAEIEMLRFGERIQFTFEPAGAVLEWRLPSLSLQPLLENAVSHGAAHCAEAFNIVLQAMAESEQLTLTLRSAPRDRWQEPFEQTARAVPLTPGHALHNLTERMRALYGPQGDLQVIRSGVSACVTWHIPRKARLPQTGKRAAI